MPEFTPPAGSGSGGDPSPLTTKGDLYGYDTDNNRIPVGTDSHVLTADSAQALGVKWAAAPGSPNTLDQAYDQGGAGAGRTIIADSGTVRVQTGATSNNAALTLVQNDAINNPNALVVENNGSGKALELVQAAGGVTIHAHDNGNTLTQSILLQPSAGVNTSDNSIAGTPTGTITLIPGTAVTPASGQEELVIIPSGNGLQVGTASSVINLGFSVGTSNVADNSVSIGSNCVSANKSIALGNAADAATNYGADAVIALSGDTNVGGSWSVNTVVIDAQNQSAGPTGTVPPAAAVPPTAAGIGNIYLDTGGFFSGSADYAEMFEWNDGNVSSADRRGFFVSLVNGNKIEVGNSDVIGVISARPVVIGDAAELAWKGQYVTDEFGTPIYDMVDGHKVPRISPNFDSTLRYAPRRGRKEWGIVGLVGKLYVRSAQVLSPGSRCTANSSGYAVAGNDYRVLQVIRQATSTQYGIVEILMK